MAWELLGVPTLAQLFAAHKFKAPTVKHSRQTSSSSVFVFAAVGILLANYVAAMVMAVMPSMGFRPQVMLTGHALLAAFLIYRARQLEVAK